MQPQALEITVSTGHKYINKLDLFHKTKQNVVKGRCMSSQAVSHSEFRFHLGES